MRTFVNALLSGAMLAASAKAQDQDTDGTFFDETSSSAVLAFDEPTMETQVSFGDTISEGFGDSTSVEPVVVVTTSKTWDVTMPAYDTKFDYKWEAEFSTRLQELTDGLNLEVEAKRLELTAAIKSKEDFLALVQSSEGSMNVDINDIAPTMKSIQSAKITLTQAESQFQRVFSQSKSTFSSLKTKSSSAKAEWEQAQQLVVVARTTSSAADASYQSLQTEVAREEAAAKLLALANAEQAAAALRMEYNAAWASVTAYSSEMQAEIIKARTVLFREWSQAVQALRISTEASNKFQLDLVYQAQAVVQQGLRQQQMLLEARKAADSAVLDADAQVTQAKANLLELQASGATQLTVEQAKLTEMDLQAKDSAAQEAARLIAAQQGIQTQKLYDAEAEYGLAKLAAEKAASRVQEDMLVKAKLTLQSAKRAASEALTLMQVEVAKKQELGFENAPSAERAAIQTQIVFLARQAEAAALQLKMAQQKAERAEVEWTAKMAQIRLNVRTQQEVTRQAVMSKITLGQEAAQIQAEAAAQAKFLRERIYQQAVSKAELVEAGVKIQVSAMKQAYDLVSGQGYEADKLDQLQNADMTKSMWTEAYEKYISSSAFNQTQTTKKAELKAAKATLKVFDAAVTALKLASETAKANLRQATAFRLSTENMLDIQTEASTRLQIAEQNKRAQAEKIARAKAQQAAERIQAAALLRASKRSTSLTQLEMEIKTTDTWSAQLQADAQSAEITLAKREAELIQAEAKARARVDGEASILTSAAMAAATKAFEVSLRAEKDLQLKITATSAKMASVTEQRAMVYNQLEASQSSLELQEQAQTDAEASWRMSARQRAGDLAAKIQMEAESRSRARWQAKRFQMLAISEAKKRAIAIRAKAEEEKSMTFYTQSSHYMPTFASEGEKLTWLVAQEDMKIKHEGLVKSSESWAMQRANVKQIQVDATTSKKTVATKAIARTMVETKLAELKDYVEELEGEAMEEAMVQIEHAELELKLAVQAEKKAIIIAQATENAASVQGQAWCMAKQKTADAEYEAMVRKQELMPTGLIAVRTEYNSSDWRACLEQLP